MFHVTVRLPMIVLLVGLGACVSPAKSDAPETEMPSNTTPGRSHQVTYIVGGTAEKGSLSMITPSGPVTTKVSLGTAIENPTDRGVIVPFPSGASLALSVTNEGAVGTVECVIKIDGVEVDRDVAEGASTAECDAFVP